MAKYWIHNGHLTVDGEKMSKSLGNFFTVHDLLGKYDGEVIRLSLLMAHYTSPLNFSHSLLDQAKNMLDRWYNSIKNINLVDSFDTISGEVFEDLLDDMNTPNAISRVCKIVDEINETQDEYKANVLIYTSRELLGLLNRSSEEWFRGISNLDKKQWILEMIEKRDTAKKNRDYKNADCIRDELFSEGIILEDTEKGTIWKKK
jgi:cysteinyl-tRNA synthetase